MSESMDTAILAKQIPKQPQNDRLASTQPQNAEDLFEASTVGDLESMQAQFEQASFRVFQMKTQYEAAARDLYTMDNYIRKVREQRRSQIQTLEDNNVTELAPPQGETNETTQNQIENSVATEVEEDGTTEELLPKFIVGAAKRAGVRKAVRVIDDHLLSQVCLVLVRTEGAVNIGQICRFAANIGITDIRLVSPICNPVSSDGRRFAHHALPLLSSLPCYDSLDDALADCSVVIGSSARDCAAAHRGCQFIEPQDIASVCVQEGIWGPGVETHEVPQCNPSAPEWDENDGLVDGIQRHPKREFLSSPRRVAILFGNEACGLNHAELSRANYCVYIPTRGAYPSLNLAHAVTVVMFSVWLTGHKRFFEGKTQEQNSVISQVTAAQASLNAKGQEGRHTAREHGRASRLHVERIRALFEATMHRIGLKGAVNMPEYFHDSTLRLARMCTMPQADLNLFFGVLRTLNTKIDELQAGTALVSDFPALDEDKYLLQSILQEEQLAKKQKALASSKEGQACEVQPQQ